MHSVLDDAALRQPTPPPSPLLRLQRGRAAELRPGWFCVPPRLCNDGELLRGLPKSCDWWAPTTVWQRTCSSLLECGLAKAAGPIYSAVCSPWTAVCMSAIRRSATHDFHLATLDRATAQLTTCLTSWAAPPLPPACAGWAAAPLCGTSSHAPAGPTLRWVVLGARGCGFGQGRKGRAGPAMLLGCPSCHHLCSV